MYNNNTEEFNELAQSVAHLRHEIAKVIVGQAKMIDLMIAAVLADGHVLLEGMPGVAKTLTAKLIAKVIDAKFSRIQFTPDLMPSDVLGTSVFNQKTTEFEFKPGPIFSNIVLIDEINRSPAKTQAALFEVMEEKQVTMDGRTYRMLPPFLVLATQNPIEQEGTYRLPEAQLDRFLFKIEIDYPSLDEETQILTNAQNKENHIDLSQINRVLSKQEIVKYRKAVSSVYVEPKLIKYIAEIIVQTRKHSSLYLGASPRASIAILSGSKAFAAMQGKGFITPEDIREVTSSVLRHRIMLTPEKEMEGVSIDKVIDQLVQSIEIPR